MSERLKNNEYSIWWPIKAVARFIGNLLLAPFTPPGIKK